MDNKNEMFKLHIYIKNIIEKCQICKDTKVIAYMATALISFIPFILLGLIPKSSCNNRSILMRLLLGFAAGSLLGDAFLHLIPHSLDDYNKGNLHLDLINMFYPIMIGMLFFYIIESIIRNFKKYSMKKLIGKSKKTDKKINVQEKINEIKNYHVGAYLNLISDFIHNFLDGMAIGVSFSKDPNLGLATTISIMFHEIPHEISDFAILIKFGFSKFKAMMFQLITAIGALLGTYFGILLFSSSDLSSPKIPIYVLPFTAGGFIYIACTCVLPEMLSDQIGILQLLIEVIGMILGVSTMEILNVSHFH